MASEVGRTAYGMTPLGAVVVVQFGGSPDEQGEPTETRYEVRQGSHTVSVLGSAKAAHAVAQGLAPVR